jgi:predicted GIY-YIG superfamily endonuclease
MMQHYQCRQQAGRIRPYRLDGTSAETFVAPASTNGPQKLYVVSRRGAFCYIGVTRRPVATRIREHLASDYGPSWKDLRDVDLFVLPLAGLDDINAEGVEAELVFLVRLRKDRWPSHQNEIHFRHRMGAPIAACRRQAQAIFTKLTKR